MPDENGYLRKEEERALADKEIGFAFRRAFCTAHNSKREVEEMAFTLVAEKMLRWLSRADLDGISSFAGIDIEKPFAVPDYLKRIFFEKELGRERPKPG
jgi:hypothetical protein